jgi:hypothetical protein
MVDSVKDLMEGCPPENVNLLYLILSGLLGLFLFVFIMGILSIQKGCKKEEFEKVNELVCWIMSSRNFKLNYMMKRLCGA